MKFIIGLAFMAASTVATEREKVYWSKFSWPTDDLPGEGAEIEIPKGWEIVYDIGTSPIFSSIKVDGALTFMPG
jgi:hypothetical protein